jgi:predicted PurR-regulated permease PerM
MSSWPGVERRRGDRRTRARRRAGSAVSAWNDLHRPVRILVFLLIAAVLIQIYHETEFVASKIFGVLLLFVFAAIIAMLLTPLVDAIQEHPLLHEHRAMAVLILNVILMAVLAGFLAILIPSVASQTATLGDQAPRLMSQAQGTAGTIQTWLNGHGLPVHISVPNNLETFIAPALGSAVQILTGILGGLINVLLIVVIAIYLQVQGREMIAALRQLFPDQQELFDFTLVAAGSTLAGYVRGQVIFAGLIALLSGIALSVIGVHFAIVIAVITFFLELVPLIGAPIAMVVAVAIAAVQGPAVLFETLAATVAIHGALAYTVGLKVMGDATRTHPLVAMLALLIGAQLGGVVGALFAVPIAGILNVYLGALYRARQGKEAFTLPPEGEATTLEHLPSLGDEITQMAEEDNISREPIPRARPKRQASRRQTAAAKRRAEEAAAKASGS